MQWIRYSLSAALTRRAAYQSPPLVLIDIPTLVRKYPIQDLLYDLGCDRDFAAANHTWEAVSVKSITPGCGRW